MIANVDEITFLKWEVVQLGVGKHRMGVIICKMLNQYFALFFADKHVVESKSCGIFRIIFIGAESESESDSGRGCPVGKGKSCRFPGRVVRLRLRPACPPVNESQLIARFGIYVI